jgi:hypothetical protein
MATDPSELKKQLEALDDEFNKINKSITSLTAVSVSYTHLRADETG